MPNGGSDSCGNCAYNLAVQELGTPPHVMQDEDEKDAFWERSHCTLRDVNISELFWTYCRNFLYGLNPAERDLDEEPIKWIYSSGIYEGYVRIPWAGKIEPMVGVPASCMICGREAEFGICIEWEGVKLGFCTNRHYIQWWKTHHQDDSVDPAHYRSPEEHFKET